MPSRGVRPWRILVVDDDPLACEQIERRLTATKFKGSQNPAHATTTTSFTEALRRLEDCRFDLIVLDVRQGQPGAKSPRLHAGVRTLEEIKKTRFLPVIFYTGVAHLVDDLDNFPLISVVKKTAGVNELAKRARQVFSSGLPAISRLLVRELETVERDYMWEFVAKNWNDVDGLRDPSRLAKVLASRIAASMEVIDASATEKVAQ